MKGVLRFINNNNKYFCSNLSSLIIWGMFYPSSHPQRVCSEKSCRYVSHPYGVCGCQGVIVVSSLRSEIGCDVSEGVIE